MLVYLTQKPTVNEHDFFLQTLNTDDYLLISDKALSLGYHANSYKAKGIIRQSDVDKIGGRVNSTWLVIDDAQWVDLVLKTDKTVTW